MNELPEPTATPTPTTAPPVDSGNAEVIALLGEINTKLDHQVVASDTITTYGVFYVPLIIVCVMLWWFFRQFINQYR